MTASENQEAARESFNKICQEYYITLDILILLEKNYKTWLEKVELLTWLIGQNQLEKR